MSGALGELRAAVAEVEIRRETGRRWGISVDVEDPTGRDDWELEVRVPAAWVKVDHAVEGIVTQVADFLSARPEMSRYRPNIAATLVRQVARGIREQVATRRAGALREQRRIDAKRDAEVARRARIDAARARRERVAQRIVAQIEAGV